MGMASAAIHRLKQKDLVKNIFGYFSEEYERSDAASIWDIVLPIEKVINYLEERCDVKYKSKSWVWIQLKRYEEELGVVLFKKLNSGNNRDQFSIAINYPFINFFQKHHLYVNEKIKVANGVFDKIKDFKAHNDRKEPIKILLGAGTLCYHISTIFAERSFQNKTKYLIHTNNLGALSQLIDPGINHDNIVVSMPEGRVDSVTHTIIGENTEYYLTTNFDFIIQGTSCIYNGDLYIESDDESIRKGTILRDTSGQKILVLTKHEFSDIPLKDSKPYGNLRDYDFIIVPKRGTDSPIKKKYEYLFEECKKILTPEIINWNYEIYRVNV